MHPEKSIYFDDMKKFILTLVAACALAFSANAQFYAGGSFGFSLATSGGSNATGWHLAPGVGYQFSERSAAGLYVMINSNSVTANPYYRFTFANVRNIKFFVGGVLTLGGTTGAGSGFLWGINAVPGIAYAVNSKFDILAHFGSIGISGSKHGEYSSTAFCLNLLETAAFGVEFKF